MRVMVTGGCGFIGANLVHGLLEQGHEVHVVDDLSNGSLDRIKGILTDVKFIELDVCRRDEIRKAVAKIDVIYHLAAQVSVNESLKNPINDARVNVLGTINVIQAAVENDIKKLIMFSSAATYGEPVKLPIDEEHPQNPKSPYGLSKLVSERYARLFQEIYPLNVTIIRPFNVYGPMQDPNSPYSGVISIFVNRALQNQDLIIYGDGKQTRDFIYIDDLVQLCLKILDNKQSDNKIFNGATGIKTSVNELARMVLKVTGSNSKIRYEAERKGDIRDSYADITVSKKILGFKLNHSIEEGLRKFVDYQRKY